MPLADLMLIGRMQSRGRAQGPGEGGSQRFPSRESGLGFLWKSPVVVAAVDLPALSTVRPPSVGLASSSAKSRSKRRRSACKVVGAQR